MSTFLLEIVTPERKVYAEQVDMVIVKGQEGEMGILAHHISLVTPLKIGPVIIKKDGKDQLVAVSGGFVEVRKEKVVILAESAEMSNEIDIDRARAAKERAEKRLADKISDYDFNRAERALQRSLTRLDVASRR